jgi:DNA repair protein RadC
MNARPGSYPQPRLGLLPVRERPAYRVADPGPAACASRELLAAVVGGARQIEIAEALLARYGGLSEIVSASVEELAQEMDGLGPARAAGVRAALELGRRLMLEAPEERTQIHTAGDVATLSMAKLAHLEQEEFWVVFLNSRHRVLGSEPVYKGNLNETQVRVGEVFREAVRRNCAAVIFAHNHPSGDPSPSPEDVATTRNLVAAGNLLGIEVLDHLVIGQGRWVSMRERGLGFG